MRKQCPKCDSSNISLSEPVVRQNWDYGSNWLPREYISREGYCFDCKIRWTVEYTYKQVIYRNQLDKT